MSDRREEERITESRDTGGISGSRKEERVSESRDTGGMSERRKEKGPVAGMGKEQVPETRDKRQKPGRKEALCENQNDGKEAEVRARIRELERLSRGGGDSGKGDYAANGLMGDLWISPDSLSAIYQAKSAGFCFGVQRAVDTVYEQISSGNQPIYTYGPIIHNEIVVRDLEEKKVRVIHSLEELTKLRTGTVVIRSHGVGREIYSIIEKNHLRMVDATCPFVRKIHRIVEEKSRTGWEVIIIGSASHPEVEGIRGWSAGKVTVVETEEEARSFVPQTDKPLCVVSQTTFNLKKFHKFVEIIKGLSYHEIAVLNTICNATEERQTEAKSIARFADVMFVIGGKHSSNTQKLYEICKRECSDTHFVQAFDDLNLRLVPFRGIVGISAGASTPNILIEEVSNLCRKTILSRC